MATKKTNPKGSTAKTPASKKVAKKPAAKKAVKKATIKLSDTKKSTPKAGEKRVLMETEYTLIHDKKKGDVDLHFNLKNPIEDRYFAYCLTLMDIHQTLEGLMKVAPPNVVTDFITAIRVLKGMSESIKMKLEQDLGYTKGGIPDAEKEKIKKILATIKEKLQSEFPDAEIVVGKGNPGDMNEALRQALEDATHEIKSSKGKTPKGKKSKTEEDEDPIPRDKKPSADLEMD